MYQHAHFKLDLPLTASTDIFCREIRIYIYLYFKELVYRSFVLQFSLPGTWYQVHTGCGKYHPLYASADGSYPLSLKLNEKGDRNTKLC